jgi:hypothetical protein
MAGVKQYAWSYERGTAFARRDSRGMTRGSRLARQAPEMTRRNVAAAGDPHANGLLLIHLIGNRPRVMRWAGSAVIEGMGDGRRRRDVYVGTGCLRSRRGYRDAG